MRRLILCCALLVLLFLLCLVAVEAVFRSAAWVSEPLPELTATLIAEDWDKAEVLCAEAEARWEKTHAGWEMMINHDDMRDIDVALVDLKTAIAKRDVGEARHELAELAFYLGHVPASERVDLGNVL